MKTIIWPTYINSEHSRGEGRKLSLEESVEEPKIREISQSLKKLKIQYVVAKRSRYRYNLSLGGDSKCELQNEMDQKKILIRLRS